MKIGLSNPFNYTGSKHRYLRDLQEILPTDDNLTVCDPFVGGGDLCMHLNETWKIFASDAMPQIVEMHNDIKMGKINPNYAMQAAYQAQVNKTDEKHYYAFRRKYNEINHYKSPLNLYVLLCHSNTNRIRFSDSGFNMPFGHRWFNDNMQEKLWDYIGRLRVRNTLFSCNKFVDCDFSQFDITLIDPPYLNSVATYNESGGWLRGDELDLHEKIKAECNKFVYFGQIWSNGKHNKLLDNFSKNYNVKVLKDTTKHCSANRKDEKTIEVMIWNF